MDLRPYQHDAIASFMRSPLRRKMIVLPTGTGKTVLGLDLARRMNARTLWLAHRDELITQPERTAKVVWPDVSPGVVKAERNQWMRDLVFASVQTAHQDKRIQYLSRKQWDLVVVDEAHHAPAQSYKKILEALGCYTDDGPQTLGLTATPERADNAAIDQVFQGVVYQYHLQQAILDGYLVAPSIAQRPIDVDLDQIKTVRGDYAQGELSEAMLHSGVVESVSRAVKECCKGRKTIVFCIGVKQARLIAEALGDRASVVHGDLNISERRGRLRRFAEGDLDIVVNCMVLTEGFDLPSVDCIVMARPTQSKALYLQCIGRGLRIHPGKQDCLIVDMVGLSKRHTLIQAPAIFGVKLSKLEREDADPALRDDQAYWDSRIRSQIEGVDTDARVALRWVRVGKAYAVDTGKGVVRLRPGPGGFMVDVLGDDAIGLTSTPVDLELAQGIAEDYVRRCKVFQTVTRNTGWRAELPATRRQKDALKKMRVPFDPDIRRGDASDLLTRKAMHRYDPATDKQIAYLRRLGVQVPEGLTKRKAGALIAKARG